MERSDITGLCEKSSCCLYAHNVEIQNNCIVYFILLLAFLLSDYTFVNCKQLSGGTTASSFVSMCKQGT